ncbi:hypothetical protein ASD8599_03504 [Ascidiaceihabitans donghaensis]|uniref:Uncharacterized protein n=1 Tax=Ascidiaceihabitans donghaensis TaxID=1510460 RepID=A0A2R8BI57_9RHOB|nr:hypothetical protein [Ascidiaceihabitans donghaensis]SPH22756.1 hypothetical protein ASD8599_03504 [Ascidiaceihabitans donghaensis]
MKLLDPDLSVAERISGLVQAEIDTARVETDRDLRHLDAFRAALVKPFETTVNFSGGVTQTCWTVTRTDGTYRVVYMPVAGYFSLCVESDFGPLDIGVHGPAMGCYGSV